MKLEIRFGNGGTMMTVVKCKFLEGVVYKQILGLSIRYNVRSGIRTPQVPSKVRYQKTKPNCSCFPQFFNHIFLHMSRKYVSVFNEEHVLDQ